MRIVLPPSETKTPGGIDETRLSWESLALAWLTPTRQLLAEKVIALAENSEATKKALGLGAKGEEWVVANRELLTSPVMPAISRYTGVLFDALGVDTLDETARTFADQHVWLFSALFGPLRATDLIPRYRLSFDSKLPELSLKSQWLPHAEKIWEGEFTLDLRSEGYRSLTPLPEGAGVFIRVVKNLGKAVAVGHANKGTKGRLVRDLVESGVRLGSRDEFLQWADSAGWRCAAVEGVAGEVYLVAD